MLRVRGFSFQNDAHCHDSIDFPLRSDLADDDWYFKSAGNAMNTHIGGRAECLDLLGRVIDQTINEARVKFTRHNRELPRADIDAWRGWSSCRHVEPRAA